MGLDQAIRRVSAETAAKLIEWQNTPFEEQDEENYPLAGDKYHTLMTEVWEGRKENHIQRAIEEITGQTVENCDYLFLTRKHVEQLVEKLQSVHADHELAQVVLPTQAGFFFGGTQYDEWYFRDIEQELEDFTKILNEWDDHARYAYWAWW